jgi:aspartyl/asparaginyl beta-hydroxylase (cupin superfamily)
MSRPAPDPRAEAAQQANAGALRAMAAGDFAAARDTLKQALLAEGNRVPLWLNLAACHRALGDAAAALEAVEGALKVDPRSFRALLMKGSLLEKQGARRQTAMLYGAAVALAPPGDALDAATVQALQRARDYHARYVEELATFIGREIGPVRERGTSVEARRVTEFVDLTLQRKPNYRQEPSEFFYPGLPAIQFWERDEFPWLADVEAQTAQVRGELEQILKDDFRDFVPYVQRPEGVPMDQWKDLNHSRRWGALHLLWYGERVAENASRCPVTMDLLGRVPQPRVPNRSPAAMFSALQPKTRIPPHTGVANTRLVCHLPLIVPDGCGFRVGNETRHWREGSAWVFDDTIEHEAWNGSEQPRVILIFDVWNPRLSQTERDLVAGVMQAMDKFNGEGPKSDL